MAEFTWVFDAPTGTYKSFTLSKRLYEAAVAETVFMDHVRPVDGYGRGKGESVTLPRFSSITEPTSGVLSETDRIPEDVVTLSTKAITVQEFGRAIPYTNLATELSAFDLENPIQKFLKLQMKLVLDTVASTAYKTAKLKYVPTGLTSFTLTSNGTPGAQASANMNVWHVESIYDIMYDTYGIPPVDGDDYVAIFRNLGLRGIKRDPAWEEWHKYTDPGAKYNGEVGRLERIRFIGTNHSQALGTIGASSVLGEGIVFGEDSVAMAEAMTPELRAAIPGDFGRSKAVAWYGIFQCGLVWDTANFGEARVVHVSST